MTMELIAHRCGTDKYPELTLDAARFSLNAGADYVEMDIRFTKEGIPVICHDDNAFKLFGSAREIAELTIGEFLSLRYRQDPHYSSLTLAQVFQSGTAPILFHVKVGGERLRKILDCIRAYNYEDRVMLGVMTPEDVETVKDYNPKLQVLAFTAKQELLELQAKANADVIRLWEGWVTQEEIDRFHQMGKRVWIMAGAPKDGSVGFTDKENLSRWREMGADGVLVNEICIAKEVLKG